MPNDFTVAIPIAQWASDAANPQVEEFLRRPAFDAQAETLARQVLAEIKREGDPAIIKYAREFDGTQLTPADLRVAPQEINAAREQVDKDFIKAAAEAHKRIMTFARAGLRQNWSISSPKGGTLGEQFTPLDRVGVYIPGGTAPLVSTVLMTVTLARVAGVTRIVACSPTGPSLAMHPCLLYALELAGATEIYRIGGIQAIGAMAYGSQTIPRVQKIVGPGGPYVTAAKKCVYGEVGVDLVAGPSEIAILADETASPRVIAADLLSQAEHGTGHEKCLLVAAARGLAEAVRAELLRQAATLSRRDAVRVVLGKGTLLVEVKRVDDGMELCNRFAPEHLEIMVREPNVWVRKARNAGAVFVGSYSPESAGDFMAGPSHVLPTGGTAAIFSGLTVEDFRKRTSIISLTRADLQDMRAGMETFGRVEGLDAHARAASIRFES